MNEADKAQEAAVHPNLSVWERLSYPPGQMLSPIEGGRLKGFHDINPIWRFRALTEVYGPCGFGWRYEIENLWTIDGADGEIGVFAKVKLYVTMQDGEDGEPVWSAALPGTGGSKLVVLEGRNSNKPYLRLDDEGYKKAVTDAIGVAAKPLGLGSAVYMDLWDGSKYKELVEHIIDVRRGREGAQQLADEALGDVDLPPVSGEGWESFDALLEASPPEGYKGVNGVNDLRSARSAAAKAGWDEARFFEFAKSKGIDLESGEARPAQLARVKFEVEQAVA